ncbi:MAG: carbohydrate ABC transporter permease [Christensenellales bacterium]|jgi:putative aldouronate transport system permease protein
MSSIFLRKKMSSGDRAFMTLVYIMLSIILIAVLYPLIYIVSSSFSSTSAVMAGRVWLLPVDFSLSGYKAIFKNNDILTGYINTIIYTVTGTLLNVVMTICAAFPLSRRDFRIRKPLMFLFVFTMFFSGGIVPLYILMNQLSLTNTRFAMILPGALSVWNMIIMRTFFESNIPKDLLEAAQLDGCSDLKFLVRIVLPLSGAVIAVISLFYAVGHWNAFFNALLYLTNKKLYPLQVFLRDILILNSIDASMISIDIKELEAKEGLKELLKYSLIIVSSVPVLCIYPFVQRHFVKGVMVGSIKG